MLPWLKRFVKTLRVFHGVRLGGSWCCVQGSACLRAGGAALLFPALAAGLCKQDVMFKWQSRTNLSPARVLFARCFSRVLADLAVERGVTWRVFVGHKVTAGVRVLAAQGR